MAYFNASKLSVECDSNIFLERSRSFSKREIGVNKTPNLALKYATELKMESSK